jgi:hypothetical protein
MGNSSLGECRLANNTMVQRMRFLRVYPYWFDSPARREFQPENVTICCFNRFGFNPPRVTL